jgi:hypothetical protein
LYLFNTLSSFENCIVSPRNFFLLEVFRILKCLKAYLFDKMGMVKIDSLGYQAGLTLAME